MQRSTFSGKTLDDALASAARALGTDAEQLGYNILPSSGSGLLSKLFQKKVQIEAWVESSDGIENAAREAVKEVLNRNKRSDTPQTDYRRPQARQGASEARNPPQNRRGHGPQREAHPSPKGDRQTPQQRRPAQPPQQTQGGGSAADRRPQQKGPHHLDNRVFVPFQDAKVTEILNQFTQEFLTVFGGGTFEVRPGKDHQEYLVLVENEQVESLLGESDRLSMAYEHLLKRILQKKVGDVAERIRLDAGEAVDVRKHKLEELALSIAEKVMTTGRAVTLNSKTSQERRVIHLALENKEGIGTRSVGTGERRKLVIFSTLKEHQQFRRQQRKKQQQPPTP